MNHLLRLPYRTRKYYKEVLWVANRVKWRHKRGPRSIDCCHNSHYKFSSRERRIFNNYRSRHIFTQVNKKISWCRMLFMKNSLSYKCFPLKNCFLKPHQEFRCQLSWHLSTSWNCFYLVSLFNFKSISIKLLQLAKFLMAS